jgi:hypothetical protein
MTKGVESEQQSTHDLRKALRRQLRARSTAEVQNVLRLVLVELEAGQVAARMAAPWFTRRTMLAERQPEPESGRA